MTTPRFVPGLELSRRLYLEAVRPLLDEAVPGHAPRGQHLRYAGCFSATTSSCSIVGSSKSSPVC